MKLKLLELQGIGDNMMDTLSLIFGIVIGIALTLIIIVLAALNMNGRNK